MPGYEGERPVTRSVTPGMPITMFRGALSDSSFPAFYLISNEYMGLIVAIAFSAQNTFSK